MVPSGWAWVWAASTRTIRPRSAAVSLGLAGSATTRKRNRATCSAGSSEPDGQVVGTATSYAGGGRGTGGSQRHPPRPAQGGLVVAPSHPPPLTIPASGQTAGAAPPSRCLTQPLPHPSGQCPQRGQGRTLSHAGQAIHQPAELDQQRAQPGHQHRRAHPPTGATSPAWWCAAPQVPRPPGARPPPPPPAPVPHQLPRPCPSAAAAQTTAAARGSPHTAGTWPAPPTPATHGRGAHTADSPTRTPSAGHSPGSPPAEPGPHGPQPGTPRRSTGKAIRWPRWQTPPWTLPEPQLLWEGPLLVQDARILPAPTSPSQISAAVPPAYVLSQSRR